MQTRKLEIGATPFKNNVQVYTIYPVAGSEEKSERANPKSPVTFSGSSKTGINSPSGGKNPVRKSDAKRPLIYF